MSVLSRLGALWRIAVAIACLTAAAWGFALYAKFNETVYWNYASDIHLYYYLQPVLYTTAGAAALLGIRSGARALPHTGSGSGRRGTVAILLLTALTLWAGFSTLLARAYLV